MVERNEAALVHARIVELVLDPVQGEFDVAHLREVHRRIFQDLPHHGPGEFRPDAPGHFKHRLLEVTKDRVVVPYALRRETDRLLGPTLAALEGGRAFAGMDTFEMSEAMAQTYARLDYLHPFREGNSRTLRAFTAQLAQANGHELDWETANVDATSRNALYVARDMAVTHLRYPGLTEEMVLAMQSPEEYRTGVQMLTQLDRYRLHDPLQEIIRRSLERGRDHGPSERRMTVSEAAREIAVLAPIAAGQAERKAEDMRLAVLRKQVPTAEYEYAKAQREWISRDGHPQTLAERLGQIDSGHITVLHEPGAPALERLFALSAGIMHELDQQRAMTMGAIDGTSPIKSGDMER